MIDTFADCTIDDQWIHVDPERAARETPFGGTIAHGFLTLSLASNFAYECMPKAPGQVMGINYGFNKLRFLSPVKAGARVRGRFEMKDVRKRSETDFCLGKQMVSNNIQIIPWANKECLPNYMFFS